MNSGTFYLYEYENNKRRRNVGFIKTARHYRSCILQIHAEGIPAGNGASLALYAFYRSNGDLIAEEVAVLNCFRRNISVRLPLSEITFPEGRPLSQIDGFIICLPGNRHPLFWMASDLFFDVDISRMRIPSREKLNADVRAAEDPRAAEDSRAVPSSAETAEEPAPPEGPEDSDQPGPQPQPETQTQPETPSQPKAKKIERSDIARLPRKLWPLANNSFLLHGYYNYHCLILVRLDNPRGRARFLLGVPGHYFSNEKYMASMFGFPHFVLSKKQPLDNGRFGYWYTDVRLGQ